MGFYRILPLYDGVSINIRRLKVIYRRGTRDHGNFYYDFSRICDDYDHNLA